MPFWYHEREEFPEWLNLSPAGEPRERSTTEEVITMMDVVRWSKSKKPELEELRKMLAQEGLASELYSDRPGTKYGRHRHDFDDFIVIVSGKMKLATDEHEWTLKPGDRLDIPTNTYHRAEIIGKEEVRYLSAAK